MSGLLVFRWIVPAFALAVSATVWVVGGPMAAGLCLIAFLLGVVTCELHHMRWTSVEEPAEASAAGDSAFLALMGVSGGGAAVEAAAAPTGPPPPPKRNFRPTDHSLAIGSGEIRLELAERHRLHVDAAERRARQPNPAAEPEAAPIQAELGPLQAPAAPEPVLELEPEMVDRPTPPEPEPRPAPAPGAAPVRAHAPPPPPLVTVLALPGATRKRAASEAFRSSYVERGSR